LPLGILLGSYIALARKMLHPQKRKEEEQVTCSINIVILKKIMYVDQYCILQINKVGLFIAMSFINFYKPHPIPQTVISSLLPKPPLIAEQLPPRPSLAPTFNISEIPSWYRIAATLAWFFPPLLTLLARSSLVLNNKVHALKIESRRAKSNQKNVLPIPAVGSKKYYTP
jgi:hypothetical protein